MKQDTQKVYVYEVHDTKCPKCGGQGRQRQGPHFDHQWRCEDCGHCWEPE